MKDGEEYVRYRSLIRIPLLVVIVIMDFAIDIVMLYYR